MKVSFSPITPVFIGSGESYYPQDFFRDEEDSFYFIDRDRFLKSIEKRGLLEKFVKVSEDIEKLLGFIDDHFTKEVAKEKISVESEVADLFNTISRPVEAFIKERYFFKPIIPGSSLKGAIRTALLDYKISIFKKDLEKKYDSKRLNDKMIETIIFCNENKNRNDKLQFDPKKDILKALIVEDLKPKRYELKVIQPLNRPFKKTKDNKIPVVLEALVDGEFEGEIRIEENLLKLDKDLKNNRYFQDEPLSIELIKKALKYFYKKIVQIENTRFRANRVDYEEFLLKIGKHSGAGSKSLNELRKIKIWQIKKEVDYQFSIWIDRDENPLGWGKLTFED